MKGPVVENVVLTVHLILAVLLIGVVLLQRSEGGGLGMGGGGGGNGVMTGRQAANALTRITWGLAAAFLITSLALTVIAARNSSNGSIVDQLGLGGNDEQPTTTLPGIGEYAPPPAAGQPVLPPVPGGAQAPAGNAAAPATAPAASEPVTPPAAQTPAQPAPATPDAAAPAAPATESPATPAPAPAN
ncbi:preprotein translocase subunit SecG [Paracoccus laeviglucosivorans]|uniref:Protein-export membrane protein SecG n=1 Tax=Paracoccus laeviglucosivorans TaxID=1197861 RepID=A0A521BX47_9RHOB|nr:preprotein translocase subunit SecG [Paracoccus laeviglucosivorans]SMO51736.1 protein translocase subunit secG [Paracoccus laeviglucosivorans]